MKIEWVSGVCPDTWTHIYCYIYLWWYHCLSIYGKIKSRGLPRTLLWIYHETRGSALIVRGPQGQGQLRHCWGSNDIFFHKYWRQWDPHRYIVFIVQIKTLDNPSIETQWFFKTSLLPLPLKFWRIRACPTKIENPNFFGPPCRT